METPVEKTDAPQGQDQSAQGHKKLKVWFQVLVGLILFLGAVYAVCLGALATHHSIHDDTKHKHKDNTAPGTQVLVDINGDDLTMSLTTVHHSGDAAICGLLHGDFDADPVDRARSLGGVNDITLAYQGAEAQHLLHLRVGSIRHSVPDDPEDAEAVVGEIDSISGDFNLVLQQGGVVSVKEDGELFATEIVCEVAEGEQQRRLGDAPYRGGPGDPRCRGAVAEGEQQRRLGDVLCDAHASQPSLPQVGHSFEAATPLASSGASSGWDDLISGLVSHSRT